MSIEALIGSAIALLAAVLAGIQVLLDQLARRRQHNADLIGWGTAVIALMAEVESHCAPFSTAVPFDTNVAEALSYKASALVDQGRLFFPNVDVPGDDRGFRVKLLDEALRTFYVARLLAKEGRSEGHFLRMHVWSSRTRFVELLQKEVRGNLRRARKAHQGESIPSDPRTWGTPAFAPEWLRSEIHLAANDGAKRGASLAKRPSR